eukprot:Nk52_evm30s152 gene=Nk52_evmTU30s152
MPGVLSKGSRLLCGCIPSQDHPWSESCTEACKSLLGDALPQGFKLYLPLYLLPALVMGSGGPARRLQKVMRIIPQAIRSACFLAVFSSSFCAFGCLLRCFFSRPAWVNQTGFLPGFLAGVLSINIEATSKHSELAVFCLNNAIECAYRMCGSIKFPSHSRRRGGVAVTLASVLNHPVLRKYGHVLLFSLSLGIFKWCYFRAAAVDSHNSPGMCKAEYGEGGIRTRVGLSSSSSNSNSYALGRSLNQVMSALHGDTEWVDVRCSWHNRSATSCGRDQHMFGIYSGVRSTVSNTPGSVEALMGDMHEKQNEIEGHPGNNKEGQWMMGSAEEEAGHVKPGTVHFGLQKQFEILKSKLSKERRYYALWVEELIGEGKLMGVWRNHLVNLKRKCHPHALRVLRPFKGCYVQLVELVVLLRDEFRAAYNVWVAHNNWSPAPCCHIRNSVSCSSCLEHASRGFLSGASMGGAFSVSVCALSLVRSVLGGDALSASKSNNALGIVSQKRIVHVYKLVYGLLKKALVGFVANFNFRAPLFWGICGFLSRYSECLLRRLSSVVFFVRYYVLLRTTGSVLADNPSAIKDNANISNRKEIDVSMGRIKDVYENHFVNFFSGFIGGTSVYLNPNGELTMYMLGKSIEKCYTWYNGDEKPLL